MFRTKDDPTNVLVRQHFATMGEAEAFMKRDDLRHAMQRAGVEGMPRFEFFDEA